MHLRSSLVLFAAALNGTLIRVKPVLQAAEITGGKGENDHKVSWKAAYAMVKSQRNGLFKTSQEHASVKIMDSVINDPGNFPDCGQFLGDLFGGNTQPATAATFGNSFPVAESTIESSDDTTRYSY